MSLIRCSLSDFFIFVFEFFSSIRTIKTIQLIPKQTSQYFYKIKSNNQYYNIMSSSNNERIDNTRVINKPSGWKPRNRNLWPIQSPPKMSVVRFEATTALQTTISSSSEDQQPSSSSDVIVIVHDETNEKNDDCSLASSCCSSSTDSTWRSFDTIEEQEFETFAVPPAQWLAANTSSYIIFWCSRGLAIRNNIACCCLD